VLFAECCGAAGKDEEFSALTVQVSADGDWIRRFDVGGYPSSGIYEGPQVATDGRVTWLAWTHDGQIQITRNRTGRFVQRDFMVNGFDLRLVASDGRAFAAWTSFHSPARVFLAEEAPDGAWTGTWVSPMTTRHQRLAALAATGGKANVLIMTPTHLYARSQP
jgi:hypothetical protein